MFYLVIAAAELTLTKVSRIGENHSAMSITREERDKLSL